MLYFIIGPLEFRFVKRGIFGKGALAVPEVPACGPTSRYFCKKNKMNFYKIIKNRLKF